jgi:hypothetical protein
VLIPRHSEFHGRANSEARNGTERNGIPRKNEVLRNSHDLYDYSDIEPGSNWRPHPCKGCMITTTLRTKWFLRTSKVFFSDTFFDILGCRILCWAGFSSAEWFGTEFRQFASIFFPRNGIPSCFLHRSRIWKGILRVCFYFCFLETEFWVVFSSADVFGREFREFASLFKRREFLVVFSSTEGFGTEFRGFLFRGTAGIPAEIAICSIYSVFRGIIFLSEILNPRYDQFNYDYKGDDPRSRGSVWLPALSSLWSSVISSTMTIRAMIKNQFFDKRLREQKVNGKAVIYIR